MIINERILYAFLLVVINAINISVYVRINNLFKSLTKNFFIKYIK
jgi:hypothetical protein